jgi:nicotinate-nucleotide adenylyltransferase
MTRYAVFGGSFDPVHVGHVAVAEAVLDQLGLDELILVPSNQNPLKRKPRASGADRLAMCRLATVGHPKIFTSDIEVCRGGRSYSVETLEDLALARPGKMWLVIATDALASFEKWKQPVRITQIARLAVVERPGTNTGAVLARLPEQIRDAMDMVETRPCRASSTEIRHLIREDRDAEKWLHPKVWEYISERGLYKA